MVLKLSLRGRLWYCQLDSACLEFGPKMRFLWWKYARIPKMHTPDYSYR